MLPGQEFQEEDFLGMYLEVFREEYQEDFPEDFPEDFLEGHQLVQEEFHQLKQLNMVKCWNAIIAS